MYLPWNMPIEALRQMLAFREVESGEEAIVPDVEGEMAEGAGDGSGDRDGDNGDGDGTTSSSSIDSKRVKAVRLAGESQHVHWSRRNQMKYSPGSSRSPIQYPNHLYGDIRH